MSRHGGPEFDGRVGVRWIDWEEELATSVPAEPVAVAATDPLYILYTSGTTGTPKGVVRDNGGYAVALAWSMKNIYDIDAGDVMWTASDVGWVVGHSYIVYGAAARRRDDGALRGQARRHARRGRVLAHRRGVPGQGAVLGTDRGAGDPPRRSRPRELDQYDTSSLDALFLAGRTTRHRDVPLDQRALTARSSTTGGRPRRAGRSRRTRAASSRCRSSPAPRRARARLPARESSTAREGRSRPERKGNIVLGLPLPPGSLPTLWSGDEHYVSSYLTAFPGHYATGDSGYVDDDGYVYVMGRTDDVINVAGHRLSTGTLEEAINHHPAVAEVAVIGVKDELKGQRAAGFVTLKHGTTVDHDVLVKEIVAPVRETVGPVAALPGRHRARAPAEDPLGQDPAQDHSPDRRR